MPRGCGDVVDIAQRVRHRPVDQHRIVRFDNELREWLEDFVVGPRAHADGPPAVAQEFRVVVKLNRIDVSPDDLRRIHISIGEFSVVVAILHRGTEDQPPRQNGDYHRANGNHPEPQHPLILSGCDPPLLPPKEAAHHALYWSKNI